MTSRDADAGTVPLRTATRTQRRPARDHPDAYLAGDRRRALGAGRELPDRVNGAAIFADISGFTPLTEALAKELGALRGAEELTAALDVVFDAVLGQLHRYSGSVIYFSGDAVTCWIDGDDGLGAVSCALAMQRAMSDVCRITTPGGTGVELGMKVAVAAGPARRFVVGDPDIQLIDVLAGSLMDRIAAAEHHAASGEVVVDGSTLDALAGRIEWRTLRWEGEDRAAVVGSVTAAPAKLPVPGAYPKLSRAVVRPWLLPAVYERMRSGRGEFLSELRPAVPMFVRFGGIDYDTEDDAPARLDEFIRRAQWLIDGHGGNVLQLTIGDKGAYLYAVFGSPLAHEDDAARACAAALDVLALEGATAATGLQVGLAMGSVRSGTYGHRQRRTFCCLGDPVNLAARLMSAAPAGTAYVTPAVAKAAAHRCTFDDLPPMRVKGKAAPVDVRRLTGRTRGNRILRTGHQLVGRSDELERLVALAERALEGDGQVVALAAEAGMGKSSLAAVVAQLVEDRGVPVHVGAAAAAGGGSYLAWRPVASSLFGVGAEEPSHAAVARRLEQVLGEVDASLLPRLPLLGPLLGVSIEDNELTAGFDAKLRKASLEALVVQYLDRRARVRPLAIVLEDCHWIDPLSSELLDVVARAAASLPILVLLTLRPGTFAAPALGHTTVVELGRLDDASCRAILEARISALFGKDTQTSATLLERLLARAEGNPFYVEELVGYLHDRGAAPDDPRSASLDLPASLATLVLSRIDTLPESPRRTLKVASVVGREFDLGTLVGAYPDLGTTRQVSGQLRRLRAEELVVLEDARVDVHSFKHAVIQEVAYESLPFALRATVHGQVGAWIEATKPDALDLLAHHFWHSGDEEKKRGYLRLAGDAAKARYANETAAEYYRRLAPLVETTAREDVLRELGTVLGTMGDWPGAELAYGEALDLAATRGDAGAAAWLRVSRLTAMRRQGNFADALEELDAVEPVFEHLGDRAGMGRSENLRGMIANHTGTHDAAWTHLQRSLEIRRGLGDPAEIATSLGNLGVTAAWQGKQEVSRQLFEECLALFVQVGNLQHVCATENNLGMAAYLEHAYGRAIPHLEEAVRVGSEIGALYTVAMARQNLGNCARESGDVASAKRHYGAALDAFVTSGDRWVLCVLLEDVASLIARDAPGDAVRLAASAQVIRTELGTPRTASEEAALRPRIDGALARLGPSGQDAEAEGAATGIAGAVDLARRVCHSS